MYRREKSLALKAGSAAALYNNLSVLAPRAKPLAHFAAVQGSAVQLVSASADGLSCSHRHLHAKEGGLAALGGTAPHAAAATIITQVRAPPGAGWESRTGRDAEAAGGSSVWPDRPAGLAGRVEAGEEKGAAWAELPGEWGAKGRWLLHRIARLGEAGDTAGLAPAGLGLLGGRSEGRAGPSPSSLGPGRAQVEQCCPTCCCWWRGVALFQATWCVLPSRVLLVLTSHKGIQVRGFPETSEPAPGDCPHGRVLNDCFLFL